MTDNGASFESPGLIIASSSLDWPALVQQTASSLNLCWQSHIVTCQHSTELAEWLGNSPFAAVLSVVTSETLLDDIRNLAELRVIYPECWLAAAWDEGFTESFFQIDKALSNLGIASRYQSRSQIEQLVRHVDRHIHWVETLREPRFGSAVTPK